MTGAGSVRGARRFAQSQTCPIQPARHGAPPESAGQLHGLPSRAVVMAMTPATTIGQRVVLLRGVAAGDEIVVEGHHGLKAGALVERVSGPSAGKGRGKGEGKGKGK